MEKNKYRYFRNLFTKLKQANSSKRLSSLFEYEAFDLKKDNKIFILGKNHVIYFSFFI
jgi:hypothetical protein